MACAAASSTSEPAANDSDLTGVTDLTDMEAALGLQKDWQQADGTWYRGNDKLEAGACYKKLIAGPDGASYQFRRYSTGASFFKKLDAGAESGDERPVLCVDIDIERWEGSKSYRETMALNDFEIDSVIRYRLGTPKGSDGAAGSIYNTFEGGAVHYINATCYGEGSTFTFDPTSEGEISRSCLAGAMFPGSNGEVGGAGLLTVYQYARLKAHETNRFSYDADAVGRFIRVKGQWDSPDQVVEYEHMDLHIVRDGSDTTRFRLTPHGAPASAWSYGCAITGFPGGPQTTTCGGS